MAIAKNKYMNLLLSTFHSFFIRYIASQDALRPLCDLLSVQDSKIVIVALSGIENILRAGEEIVRNTSGTPNPYALQVEESFGE